MKIYIDTYAGNDYKNYAINPPILGSWMKLIHVGNPRDPKFEANFYSSKGKFKRGVYALPSVLMTPAQNYDEIMKIYPKEDGELPFLLDIERDSSKSPFVQAKEYHELLIRLNVTLGRKSLIYTRKEWWDRNVSTANPDWVWEYDFMIALYPYSGPNITMPLDNLEKWLEFHSKGIWPEAPKRCRSPKYWQISGDTILIPEISGPIDVIIENETAQGEIPMFLYYPIDRGFRVSQVFGVNPQWYQSSGGHNGIDWAIPVGNKIYAAQDGKVIRSEESTVGYGRHIRIQSSDGITIYGHLSKRSVNVGDIVVAKQIIGYSGGATTDPYSGNSTGPHLHFEYRPNIVPASKLPGTLGGAVDPMPFLVDHSYPETQPQIPILFKARCIVASLYTRSSPKILNTNKIGGIGYNQIVDVYEESNGWFRIDPYAQVWCSGDPKYMQKIEGSGTQPTNPEIPSHLTVEQRLSILEREAKSRNWNMNP